MRMNAVRDCLTSGNRYSFDRARLDATRGGGNDLLSVYNFDCEMSRVNFSIFEMEMVYLRM